MRIGVVSDSHASPHALAQVLHHMGHVDMLIHLGDGLEDLQDTQVKSLLPQRVIPVRGNNDWRVEASRQRTEQVTGTCRILMTHGDGLRVKMSLDRLYYSALEVGANVALYGHTHVPRVDFENGVWFMNPGAVCRPLTPCYGLLLLEDGQIKPQLVQVPFPEKNGKL